MNFEMESLIIHFFTPLIIRDVVWEWSGFNGEKSLQASQLSTSKCAFMSKKFLYSLNSEKNTFIWFCLVYFALSDYLKKCTFFPNLVVSRFEENSIIVLVWLS